MFVPRAYVITLNPVVFKVLNNFHPVELTTAASFKGNLAWVCIRFNNSGFPDKNSLTSWLLLSWLHLVQATVKLDTRSEPPLDLG